MHFTWENILAPEEVLKKEFTISKRYRMIILAGAILLGLAAIISTSSLLIGITIFLLGIIYWIYITKAKHYAFTNKRIILVDFFIGITTISIDYDKITDIEIEQSFVEQIGGWGTIILNTAGTNSPQFILPFIDNPAVLKKELDGIRDTILPLPVTIEQEIQIQPGEETTVGTNPPIGGSPLQN